MSEPARFSALIIGLVVFALCCFGWVAVELLKPADDALTTHSVTPIESVPGPTTAAANHNPPSVHQTTQPLPFLTSEFLEESLARLASNGSDLSLPMPSRHRIRTESRSTARSVTEWGAANGFAPSPVKIRLGHGGVEFFDVDLVFTAIPTVEQIRTNGAQIRAGVAQFPGADYFTWVGEIVSPLPRFTAIEHKPEEQARVSE